VALAVIAGLIPKMCLIASTNKNPCDHMETRAVESFAVAARFFLLTQHNESPITILTKR